MVGIIELGGRLKGTAATFNDYKRGTQIIYVPSHADGNINHPDCEVGFITSVCGSMARCRYWLKDKVPRELRTKANSEQTPIRGLVFYDTVPQQAVEDALQKWCKAERT